jgi:hypothetical protein
LFHEREDRQRRLEAGSPPQGVEARQFPAHAVDTPIHSGVTAQELIDGFGVLTSLLAEQEPLHPWRQELIKRTPSQKLLEAWPAEKSSTLVGFHDVIGIEPYDDQVRVKSSADLPHKGDLLPRVVPVHAAVQHFHVGAAAAMPAQRRVEGNG